MSFKEGDWVLIQHGDRKYLKKLTRDFSINVRKEVLKFSDIEGKACGDRVGNFELYQPTLEDIVMLGFERQTQIIYPKDAFYIALRLDLDRSKRVLEFGTGSGALCAVLSRLAGEVYTYEAVERLYRTAKRNLQRFNLGKNVVMHNLNFADAHIDEGFFDSAFVDVKDPLPYIDKLHISLKEGAPLGFLLPTANQVIDLLRALEGRFGGIEVLEILTRKYKRVAERFRPEDTMVAHTAYLLFCRKLRA